MVRDILSNIFIGARQSPINVETKDVQNEDRWETKSKFKNIENGTIRLDENRLQVEYQNGILTFKDYVRTSKWKSLNFHFHVPGEHQIDGKQFDAEMHMVFQGETFPEENAVLGLLFEAHEDAKPDQFIESLHIDQVKTPKGEKTGLKVSLTELYGNLTSYETYNYLGSLTIPQPYYSENVNWFLFTEPVKISPKQLEVLKKVWGDKAYPQCVLGNARYLQKVGSRIVHKCKHTFEGEP